MRLAGSLFMAAADSNQVPAGSVLVVDRDGFAQAVTEKLERHLDVTIHREEITGMPREDWAMSYRAADIACPFRGHPAGNRQCCPFLF